MPNPAQYKDKTKFMHDCMHQTVDVEKKDKDQGIAQCLNMWRDKHPSKKDKYPKDAAYNVVTAYLKTDE